MPALTMLDMELLHHYSISTSLTLSGDPVVRNYFHESVPRLGFSNPYVLQSVLALAASHLAHFRPESRQYYYAHAKARHTSATAMATPLFSDISATTAVPMYCFSIMTLFIAFASLRDEDDLHYSSCDVVPSWMSLFRGVRIVLESNNGSIFSSPIAYVFYSTEVNKIWHEKQSELEALMEFQGYLEASTAGDEHTQQLLVGVFQELRRALYFYYGEDLGNEAKVRSLFTWMYRVPGEFVTLLKQKNQEATCVLAFFCVLLHQVEYHWWFQGWGVHLIDRIYTALDEVHRCRIKWPIQQIGWIPKRETPQHAYLHTPPSIQ
jgi:hypothetical protein